MELKEFIKETLVQICDGIKDAQENTKDKGAAISPKGSEFRTGSLNDGYVDIKGVRRYYNMINFSIVLSGTSSSKKGIGVVLGNVSIGGDLKNEKSDTKQTSITFSVPVLFPQS